MVPKLFENLRSNNADLSHNGALNRKYGGVRSKQRAHNTVGFFMPVYFVKQNE